MTTKLTRDGVDVLGEENTYSLGNNIFGADAGASLKITNSRYDGDNLAEVRETQKKLLDRSSAALARLNVVAESIDNLAGVGLSVPIHLAREQLNTVIDDLHLAIGSAERVSRAKDGHIQVIGRQLDIALAGYEQLKEENAKLQDRATIEWSNGQDKRIYQLEEGLRQLARDGFISRSQSSRIRRAGLAAHNNAAGIGAAE